jgi:NAD(P)-dependent dehydrogenase (short-subunit alcohol dehydrogenase family)
MANKIWFITGVSSGFGRALAEAVINKGDFVIGSFRQQIQADEFN